jgi:GntR family transcriptional regulator
MSRQVTEIERIIGPLRARILAGEFGADGKLPTEAELCDMHGVSRPTIREVYRRLILEGLVVSIERRGYYVHMMRPIELRVDEYERPDTDQAVFTDGVDQWEREVIRQGRQPRVRVEVRMLGGDDSAPDDVEKRLGVGHGAPVLIRDRTCWVDETPWMLRPSYFPGWLADEYPLLRQPGDLAAPGGLLVAIGRPAAEWHDEWRARMPTVAEAERLMLPSVTPGIEWTRTRVDAAGVPLAVMQAFLPGDRVSLADTITVG